MARNAILMSTAILGLLSRSVSAAFLVSGPSERIRQLRTNGPIFSQWEDDVSARVRQGPLSQQERSEAAFTTPSSVHPSSVDRTVDRVEKFARLPVWPVWNGVLIFVISKVFGNELAAKLENAIGGRVCPNFFVPERTSPFIMLVHHCHSFAPWDPLRYIQRTFFPEGFPAHPHRGFITVTYFLKGGFEHRDSMGVKQLYGAEKRHKGKHTQWLMTGAGMLHEEMFDISSEDGFFRPSSQELYQLWLNVPAAHKMDNPRVDLLGGPDETPTVEVVGDNGSKTQTVVLAGEYQGKKSVAALLSPVKLFHVRMDPGSTWQHELPSNYQTGIIYVRTGSIEIGNTHVPTHHTAYLSSTGRKLTVTTSKQESADFMLLAGEPLNEPVSAQGSMVMNSSAEINQAYADYQRGHMGAPWDHKISDEEWMEHNKKYPSMYKQ